VLSIDSLLLVISLSIVPSILVSERLGVFFDGVVQSHFAEEVVLAKISTLDRLKLSFVFV